MLGKSCLSVVFVAVVVSGCGSSDTPSGTSPDTLSTGGSSGSGGAASSGGAGATGASTGGVVSVGGAPNAALPQIGGCNIFTATSPWNTDISAAKVHARNTQYLAAFDVAEGHRAIHLDLGSTETYYGIPHAVVPADQAKVDISYGTDGNDYGDESDHGPFPIPLNVQIEGQDGTTDPTDGDRHVVVVQSGTCVLYELFAAVRTTSPPGFECSSSAKWDLKTNSTRPAGWTSADAAGLPIFPGLLRYDEIKAGAINHALRVTAPHAQKAYIAPASHLGPEEDATLPPYGVRVRLKADFPETGYSKDALVLIHALKRYGLMYADQGTGWYVSGSSDPAFADLIDEIHGKKPIPSSEFEFVDTGKATCGYGAAGACN